MFLPIDVLPNTSPPQFRWKQVITTPIGDRVIEHCGPLPPSMEDAITSLITLAKMLKQENAELKKQVEVHSELLSKNAEKHAEQREKLLSSRREKGGK